MDAPDWRQAASTRALNSGEWVRRTRGLGCIGVHQFRWTPSSDQNARASRWDNWTLTKQRENQNIEVCYLQWFSQIYHKLGARLQPHSRDGKRLGYVRIPRCRVAAYHDFNNSATIKIAAIAAHTLTFFVKLADSSAIFVNVLYMFFNSSASSECSCSCFSKGRYSFG